MLRLLTMRCSEKQMTLMLTHEDSPYIRCIGFLYLRYACEPRELWKWVQPYLYDEEPVQVVAHKAKPESTVGAFVRSILSDLDYHGTRLPRLPVSIERDIKVKMLQAERLEERAKRHLGAPRDMEYFQKLGSKVRALYEDEDNPITWYDAVVDRVITTDSDTGKALSRPKFVVTFTEYGNTETVTLGEMDMPGHEQDDSRGKGRGWDDRGRGNSRRDRDDRGRRREDYGSRDRYDRRGGYGRDDRDGHRGHGSKWEDYDRDSRGYRGRSDGRGREERWERGGQYRRDRSRSRERPQDSADLMKEVLRRERENSTAKGRAYAARPPTTKTSLATRVEGKRTSTVAHDPPAQHRKQPPQARREDMEDPKPVQREKSAAELAAIAEKKQKLLARYG